MKTIAVNNRSAFRGLFVLAALGALYYYRRQGGTVSGLLARGTDALGSAREFVNRVAPSVSPAIASRTQTDVNSVAAGAQI